MNIIDLKSRMDELTTHIISEYVKLEQIHLQEQNNSVTTLLDINSKSSSMCEALQLKTNEIIGLEREIEGHRLREKEYIRVMDNQRKRLEREEQESDNSTKFDIIRGQAKEISAKDKEIERLTKEAVRLKELNDMKQTISMVVDQDDTVSEEDDEDEEELFIVTYRKKKYYRDDDNKAYRILENEDKGDCIGNWVKGTNGRFKLVKS